jgi:hypothetical protein
MMSFFVTTNIVLVRRAEISPIFKADTVRLHGSREKDGKLRLGCAGMGRYEGRSAGADARRKRITDGPMEYEAVPVKLSFREALRVLHEFKRVNPRTHRRGNARTGGRGSSHSDPPSGCRSWCLNLSSFLVGHWGLRIEGRR